MNRSWPISVLFLIFLYLGANVSSMWLWIITGVAVFLLFGLMFAMYQKGQFVGPKTLVDDVISIKDRFVFGDDENNDIETVEVAAKRRRSSSDDQEI